VPAFAELPEDRERCALLGRKAASDDWL